MTTGQFGPAASEDKLPPLTFELSGFNQDDEVVGPVKFICKRRIQGARLTKAVAMQERGDAGAGAIVPWMRDCMINEAEQVRFTETVDSEDFIVELQTLANIFMWLVEQYTNRPTRPSVVSQNGPSGTSPILTDGSFLPAPPTPTSSTPSAPTTSFTPV